MERLLLSVLNMSMTASFVILAVCLVRLLLKRAPKAISYALWAVVAFRLIVPFSFESVFSLMPIKSDPIPQDIVYQAQPRIDTGIQTFDNAISASLPTAEATASANPMQIALAVGTAIWLLGIAIMLIYSFVTMIMLKRRLQDATHIEGNIYEVDKLKTPFVIGFFNPSIYLPAGLSGEEQRYILLHEQTHIKRKDHIVKMIAYFVLCLHWFNPLVWMAFLLMGADMELSCDERVLKELGSEIKKEYSASLLTLSTGRRMISGSPLAFGEGGVKGRIKNVLNFKKRSRVIIIAAVVVVAVVSIGFAVNRASVIVLPNADEVSSISLERSAEVSSLGEVSITDKDTIKDILQALSGAAKTSQASVNDTPMTADYLIVRISFGDRVQTLFLYTDGEDYIEEPYVGIYRAKRQVNFVHSTYAAYSMNGGFPRAKAITLTTEDIDRITVGTPIDEVHSILGEPDGFLSGLFGEIYELVGGKQAIIYYDDSKVVQILIDNFREDTRVRFSTDRKAYTPEFIAISAQLMNIGREGELRCGEAFSLYKLTGNSWQPVHYKDGVAFGEIAMVLDYGDSQNFTLTPDMLTSRLDEGRYMIETDVYYENESGVTITQTVQTAFDIDKNAEVQTTYTLPDDWMGNPDGREMSIEDLRTLAGKGADLVFADFDEFRSINVSSSFSYLMLYRLNAPYSLIVGSSDGVTLDRVTLEDIWGDGGSGIDLRYGGLEEFINDRPIFPYLEDGSLSPTGMTLILENLTDKEYTYGSAFSIQRKTDEGWVDVEAIIDNYGFNDEGYTLRSREIETIIIHWEWLYGELPPGEYRIFKDAQFKRSSDEYDAYPLYASFTIES